MDAHAAAKEELFLKFIYLKERYPDIRVPPLTPQTPLAELEIQYKVTVHRILNGKYLD